MQQNIRPQLDSKSELSIINYQTWKRPGKPTLIKTNRIAKGITGDTIKFIGELVTNVSFKGKTIKLKAYVMKKAVN